MVSQPVLFFCIPHVILDPYDIVMLTHVQRCLFITVFSFLCLAFPIQMHAEEHSAYFSVAGLMDPYHARLHPTSRANSIKVLSAQIAFVWEQSASMPREDREMNLICLLRNMMPARRGAGFHRVLADQVTVIIQADDSDGILQSLTSSQGCRKVLQPSASTTVTRRMISVPIDIHRKALSKNPVWNACTRSQGLSIDLIRANADVFEHRQGRHIIHRPWTCRDYHRGAANEWLYPDIPHVRLLLDGHGVFIAGTSDQGIVVARYERSAPSAFPR